MPAQENPPVIADAGTIRTARLLLRRWRATDRDPFAALNADPAVMEHFPALLTRVESDALVDRIEQHFHQHGFGLWAVEAPDVTSFAGFVGLSVPRFQARFTPCVEIGWRLARACWGQGFATEALRALTDLAPALGIIRLHAVCHVDHAASAHVLEKCGFEREGVLRRHSVFPNSGVDGPLDVLSYARTW